MNLPNFGGIFELKASYIGSYSSFSIPLLELLPSASQLYQHELKASYIGSYSSFSIPLLEQLPSASHAMPGSEFCSLTVIRCQVKTIILFQLAIIVKEQIHSLAMHAGTARQLFQQRNTS